MARISKKSLNSLEILGAAFLKVLFESDYVDLRALDLLCPNGADQYFHDMIANRMDDDTFASVLREAKLDDSQLLAVAKDEIAACIARCLEVKSVKITL